MIIEAVKSALPFEVVLRDAGVNLRNGKAPCPFHEDKTPSFTVKGERGRCWAGCFSGDVIDFAAKYYNLDTKGAINILAERAGLKYGGSMTQAELRAAQKARLNRQAIVKGFRRWEQHRVNEIARTLRAFNHMRATRTNFTEAELITLAELHSDIDILEYHYAILCGKDDRLKFELYKEGTEHGG